jgi:predicted kinase
MPKLVIINGKPAVGKSTLARVLRERLSVPVLGKDDLKECLFETIGVDDREWSLLVGRASIEMLYAFAGEFLADGKNVVIECPFWTERAKPRLQALCTKYNTECLEIYCEADEVTRRYRNKQRLQDGRRHPGYRDEQMVIDDAVDNERYAPLEIGQLLRLDTTQLDEQHYQDIVQTVQQFLTEPA